MVLGKTLNWALHDFSPPIYNIDGALGATTSIEGFRSQLSHISPVTDHDSQPGQALMQYMPIIYYWCYCEDVDRHTTNPVWNLRIPAWNTCIQISLHINFFQLFGPNEVNESNLTQVRKLNHTVQTRQKANLLSSSS